MMELEDKMEGTVWESCCCQPCPLCLVWGWQCLPGTLNQLQQAVLFWQSLVHVGSLGRIQPGWTGGSVSNPSMDAAETQQ